MKKNTLHKFRYISILCIVLCSGVVHAKWKTLDKSIQHNYFQCDGTIIHAVRFKPNEVYIKAFVYPPYGRRAASVLKNKQATIVINGGYFTPDIIPIGLIISDGRILSKIHKTSWWSIFLIDNEKAKIITPSSWKNNKNIKFVIQAGPRLVINGKIPKLKDREGKVPRSAIGIDEKGNVIIAMAASPGLTIKRWGECLMQKTPNGPSCVNAMNLDGGSSSQMSLKSKDGTRIDELGISTVPSFIAVWPKNLESDNN